MSDVLDRAMDVLEGAHRYERYVLALCPFHEDSKPSLLVFPDGWYRCLAASCGKNGRVEELFSRPQNPFARPTKKLVVPHMYGDPIELLLLACQVLRIRPEYKKYLLDRGITETQIREKQLGYHEGWYTFPVFEPDDVTLKTIVFRAGPQIQEWFDVRYHSFGKATMYGPHIQPESCLFVTYGIFDMLTINALEYPAVTSTYGALSFKPEWLDEYRLPIYIVPDKGEEEQARKHSALLGWRGNILYLPYSDTEKDPNDMYVQRPQLLKDNLLGVMAHATN
jgi:hypothetical protein